GDAWEPPDVPRPDGHAQHGQHHSPAGRELLDTLGHFASFELSGAPMWRDLPGHRVRPCYSGLPGRRRRPPPSCDRFLELDSNPREREPLLSQPPRQRIAVLGLTAGEQLPEIRRTARIAVPVLVELLPQMV